MNRPGVKKGTFSILLSLKIPSLRSKKRIPSMLMPPPDSFINKVSSTSATANGPNFMMLKFLSSSTSTTISVTSISISSSLSSYYKDELKMLVRALMAGFLRRSNYLLVIPQLSNQT